MKFASLLSDDLILWNVDISNYKNIYEIISKKVSKKFNLPEEEIYNSFVKRDELGQTVLKGGIAIPHGRLENFNDLIIGIVKTNKEIEFGDKKADIFFILLTSNVGSNLYLKTLSAIGKIARFHIEGFRSQKASDDLIKFIASLDLHLEEALKVKDIMTSEIVIAKLDETIIDVVDRMKKYNIIFLPVADENGTYLGKIDLVDILQLAYPNYVLKFDNLAFLSNLRAYEEFSEKEKNTLISEIYVKNSEAVINQDSNIIELGFHFVKRHWHHLSVIDEDRKIVGVVSMRDVLHNILRV